MLILLPEVGSRPKPRNLYIILRFKTEFFLNLGNNPKALIFKT